MTITGKDLQDAYAACHPELFGRSPALDWQDVDDNTKALHEAVADELNKVHVQPLQGRVQALEGHNRTLQQDLDQTRTEIDGLKLKTECLENLLRRPVEPYF